MSGNQANQVDKQWFVNSEGDITDGESLIAEPNYLTRESYKNAHLMSAAPELLAACELAEKYLTTIRNNKGGSIQSVDAAIFELSQAIAKAKGV